MTISDKLCYSTIRIECQLKSGETSTGTGFFFNFLENISQSTYVPVIITNKHVIENSILGKLIFTKSDEKGNPLDTDHYIINITSFEGVWRKHPDNDVDLCAMPIAYCIDEAYKKGIKLFYLPFDKSIIPTNEHKLQFSALEDILMIGYPNGIWDEINNKPLLRRGITATHPNKDYNGKKEIMIDIACFPGSSGSPVVIYNNMNFIGNNSGVLLGDKLFLLGVLYAGPYTESTGEIKIINVPTINKPISISRIMINLGFIIKSERIMELEKLFM